MIYDKYEVKKIFLISSEKKDREIDSEKILVVNKM